MPEPNGSLRLEEDQPEGSDSQAEAVIASPSLFSLRHIALLVILSLAFFFRFSGVRFGYPYTWQHDEPEIANAVMRYLRHNMFRPVRFDYGPVTTYIYAAWSMLAFIHGIGKGAFSGSIWEVKSDLDTGWYFTVGSPYLLLQMRYLATLLGCVSVYSVYGACKALGNRRAGLWGAALMAVSTPAINSTQVVSVDSITICAAAVCLWASVIIFEGGGTWSYVAAAVAAGISASAKYSSISIVAAPIVAHFFASFRGRQRKWTAGVLWFITVLGLVVFALMLPALIEPNRFLNDQWRQLRWYGSNTPETFGTRVGNSIRALLVCVESSSNSDTNYDLGKIVYKFRWQGFGLLALLLVGCFQLAKRRLRLLMLLLVVIGTNIVLVTGYRLFPRNLLISILACSILVGIGADSSVKFIAQALSRGRQIGRHHWGAAAACVALLFLPVYFDAASGGFFQMEYKDPRVLMSEWMLQNIPAKSKIVLLDEVRYTPSSAEKQKFEFARSTILRSRNNPLTTTSGQYLLAPYRLDFVQRSERRDRMEERMNSWLTQPAKVVASFGSTNEPTRFYFPTRGAAVRLIKLDADFVKAHPADSPQQFMFGPSFDAPGAGPEAIQLSDNGIAVPVGQLLTCPIARVSTTTKILFRGRSLNPFSRERSVPDVSLELIWANRPDISPTHVDFRIDRPTRPSEEYWRTVELPPGNYIAKVRVSDEESQNLPFEIESFTFESSQKVGAVRRE